MRKYQGIQTLEVARLYAVYLHQTHPHQTRR